MVGRQPFTRIAIVLLFTSSYSLNTSAQNQQVVLFPPIDVTNLAGEFNEVDAMAALADNLQQALRGTVTLVPQIQVDQLCEEFSRSRINLERSSYQSVKAEIERAKRICEGKLHASYSIGFQIIDYSLDEKPTGHNATACSAECGNTVLVNRYGQTCRACDFRRVEYTYVENRIDVQITFEVYAYKVSEMRTIMQTREVLRSKNQINYIDSDSQDLWACPTGSLRQACSYRLDSDGFERLFEHAERLDAHEMLSEPWRLFSKDVAREFAGKLGIR